MTVLSIWWFYWRIMYFQKFIRFSYWVCNQFVLNIDNNITTEITSRLIDITLNEKNQINFVIPETQMPFYSSEEKKRILKLYSGIEKKVTPVIEIESFRVFVLWWLDKVSSSFLQLYLNTMVSSLRDVEKISFKNVPLSRNQFLMVISYIRRFIEYGRCEKLTCLNFRGIWHDSLSSRMHVDR